MNCDTAREALSARIDGEREPIPAARVDEHLTGCEPCRQWQAAAVEQTQLIRRLAGRSQLAAVRASSDTPAQRFRRPSVSWQRWALGAVGAIQVALAVAQGLGADLGVPHGETAGHVLNESTAWSAALGVAMLAAAARPVMAGGLMWVLARFVAVLALYEVIDTDAGRVSIDRPLTHLPLVAGALLALLVWRRDRPGGDPEPDHAVMATTDDAVSADIVLPENASRGRRRGHLRSTDGSAA
jgi:predicted anti-sigma-YlaC factor YlaD